MWGCGVNNLTGVGNWWFWGGGILGFFFKLLIIIIIIYALFKVIKPSNSKASKNLDRIDSLGIIKERLARGEINEKEYQRLKDILS